MTTRQIFTEELVSWIVDDIEVHATLTRPTGEGPFLHMLLDPEPVDAITAWLQARLLPGAVSSKNSLTILA